MATTIIDGNLLVQGTLSVASTFNGVTRASINQTELAKLNIPHTDWRVWDAFGTNLPATSAADDLGLYGGTFATDSPAIKSYDVKAAGAVTLRARAVVRLPLEYDDGQSVKIRASAGMQTTIADTSATIDFEAYLSNEAGSITGSDLVTTSATSINSLTAADKDFTLTTTALTAGCFLDIRMTVVTTDGATATAVIARIGAVKLLCDVRG